MNSKPDEALVRAVIHLNREDILPPWLHWALLTKMTDQKVITQVMTKVLVAKNPPTIIKKGIAYFNYLNN